MSSLSINANIDNIAMPSPPPYEVLKLQWQIKELRRMLRLSELNLAKITEPRPLFLEPLTVSPIASSTTLGRAPANHVWQDDHWVHQDSEAGRSVISSSDLPQESTPSPPPSGANSVAPSQKKNHIQWNKVTMNLSSEETIRSIIKDINERRLKPHQSSVSWTCKKHNPGSEVNQYILDCFRRNEGILTFETLKEILASRSDPWNLIKDNDGSVLKAHLREFVNQGILSVYILQE